VPRWAEVSFPLRQEFPQQLACPAHRAPQSPVLGLKLGNTLLQNSYFRFFGAKIRNELVQAASCRSINDVNRFERSMITSRCLITWP
jgi:hypothetical protein